MTDPDPLRGEPLEAEWEPVPGAMWGDFVCLPGGWWVNVSAVVAVCSVAGLDDNLDERTGTNVWLLGDTSPMYLEGVCAMDIMGAIHQEREE